MKLVFLAFAAVFIILGISKAMQKQWKVAIVCAVAGAVDLWLAYSLMS